MFFEERDHLAEEITPSFHGETEKELSVVVVPGVLDQVATLEHSVEELERSPRGRCLGNRELVLDLPAEAAPRVANHGDRETAFAVNEADDPLLNPWPFLLIVRTGRIFTAHVRTLKIGYDKNEYRRILGVSSK
jgi:hypothetical protein